MSFDYPKNAVVLAAGRGSRLGALTEQAHKSLLPVAGRPALEYILDQLIGHHVADIVLVTGHRHADVSGFVRRRYGDRMRIVHNPQYAQDANILSTDLGVEALPSPERGYLIVETDLVIEERGWHEALRLERDNASFWVTRGEYSRQLTGGALRADHEGRVSEIRYRPEFDPECDGWHKLLGMLYVGPAEVDAYRRLRKEAIARTVGQYYMMPWVYRLAELPCRVRDLGTLYASSYNDVAGYRAANAAADAHLRSPKAGDTTKEETISTKLVDVTALRHIEGFSRKRVEWLKKKILAEGIWRKPVALDDCYNLVLDGQHRLEVAHALGLTKIPAVMYRYAYVEVWSLRSNYEVDWIAVVQRVLGGGLYPYKTVKHRFPIPVPECAYSLSDLR